MAEDAGQPGGYGARSVPGIVKRGRENVFITGRTRSHPPQHHGCAGGTAKTAWRSGKRFCRGAPPQAVAVGSSGRAAVSAAAQRGRAGAVRRGGAVWHRSGCGDPQLRPAFAAGGAGQLLAVPADCKPHQKLQRHPKPRSAGNRGRTLHNTVPEAVAVGARRKARLCPAGGGIYRDPGAVAAFCQARHPAGDPVGSDL